MLKFNLYLLLSGVTSLSVVLLITVTACSGHFRRLLPSFKCRQRNNTDKLYEDDDGIATEETQQCFSQRPQTVVLIITALLGCLASLITAVLWTVWWSETLSILQWINFVGWICLMLQALNVLLEYNCQRKCLWGLYGSVAALLLVFELCFEAWYLWIHGSHFGLPVLQGLLVVVQVLGGLCYSITGISIPRRPDVLHDNIVVDKQYTTSIFQQLTFSWVAPLLQHAKKNQRLTLDDLPALNRATRSEYLQQRLPALQSKDKLWTSIVLVFRRAFIIQWILSFVVAFSQFGPQYALYGILKGLESRDLDGTLPQQTWLFVILLGAALLLNSWLETYMFWHVFEQLSIPIRAQLSALVFTKSMKRKNVKVSNKSTTEDLLEQKQDAKNEEDTSLKTQQSTINLALLDTRRVGDFSAYNGLFPHNFVKLGISFAFLCNIIGWQSLLAGLAAFLLIIPVNWVLSKRYADAQGKLMKVRDQKTAIVTEALQGIRAIKMSALERQWFAKINEKRSNELNTQWRVYKIQTFLDGVWILGPILLSAVSLPVYSILNGRLSASVAFTAISVFGQIEGSLAVIPELCVELMDAVVSARRIEKYLKEPEQTKNTVDSDDIEFIGASVAWPVDDSVSEERFMLKDINLKFPSGKLSVISGKTGSGKSLLLASILGESDILTGNIKVPARVCEQDDVNTTQSNWIIPSEISFVPQIPWIENATIQENILFGLPYVKDRYDNVILSCALKEDLEHFPDGDLTDIGVNGVNLSGGQKARLAFARALYSRAGILILDDIFSAVDTHVGLHLFEEALTGELAYGRTRILVTHHTCLCSSKTDYSILLDEGTVQYAGTAELSNNGNVFQRIFEETRKAVRHKKPKEHEGIELSQIRLPKAASNPSKRSHEQSSTCRTKPKKFIEEESRETGSVKLKVYWAYLKATGNMWFRIMIPSMFFLNVSFTWGRTYWVNIWTRSYRVVSMISQSPSQQIDQLREVEADPDLLYYLSVYVLLSISTVIVGTIKYFILYIGGIRASRKLFESLTKTILGAPLRWLDTVPVGRILNRFTSDFELIDSRIPNDAAYSLYFGFNLLLIIFACSFVSPFILVFAAILLLLCGYVASFYLVGAREVKRLESTTRSPIFEQFDAALTGLTTIRAFNKVPRYFERMFAKIDANTRGLWYLWVFNRWLAMNLNLIGSIFAILVAGTVVWQGLDASLSGFSLSFALQFTSAIVFMMRYYANSELDMNSTERVLDYTNIPTEDQKGIAVPAAWPTSGRIEVENLVVGYAEDLPPVLKGLSFTVEPNSRVGIVGRTGAGKSSLILALFRFLGAYREGNVFIDGVDISNLKLHDLRTRMAIIPQDPVLFSGTIRSNLDPFNLFSDVELFDALERVHLVHSTGSNTPQTSTGSSGSSTPSSTPINVFNDLSSPVCQAGLNLSQGQRQLLCLARAIISRPKIMFLDEATSAVDMKTDNLIQQSIREEFKDSTLVVIAHRLSTIVDFDNILVMKDGKASEFGPPRRLWESKGEFWDMVRRSGERERLEEIMMHGN